jgi:hypothetical protein
MECKCIETQKSMNLSTSSNWKIFKNMREFDVKKNKERKREKQIER